MSGIILLYGGNLLPVQQVNHTQEFLLFLCSDNSRTGAHHHQPLRRNNMHLPHFGGDGPSFSKGMSNKALSE